MEEEIEKKKIKLHEVFKLGKEMTSERQHILTSLERVVPEIVDEYDRFFDPRRRSERLADAAKFERTLKASGEEGLMAKSSRRGAKEKYLAQVGYEQKSCVRKRQNGSRN